VYLNSHFIPYIYEHKYKIGIYAINDYMQLFADFMRFYNPPSNKYADNIMELTQKLIKSHKRFHTF